MLCLSGILRMIALLLALKRHDLFRHKRRYVSVSIEGNLYLRERGKNEIGDKVFNIILIRY